MCCQNQPCYITNNFGVGLSHDCFLSVHFTCVEACILLSGVIDGHGVLHANHVDRAFAVPLDQEVTVPLPDHVSLFVQLTGQVDCLTLDG